MHQHNRTWYQVAILVVALLTFAPSIALADPGGDSASGHTFDGFIAIDFSARGSNLGAGASGNARVTLPNNDPNIVLAGEVTCLRVVGATATADAIASIGVRVTRNTAPAGNFFATQQSMIIFARDSGKFSGVPDGAVASFSSGPAPVDGACPVPFITAPTGGDVTIQNAFP